jgi:hypothetical protein
MVDSGSRERICAWMESALAAKWDGRVLVLIAVALSREGWKITSEIEAIYRVGLRLLTAAISASSAIRNYATKWSVIKAVLPPLSTYLLPCPPNPDHGVC